jgi:hypothetical protein
MAPTSLRGLLAAGVGDFECPDHGRGDDISTEGLRPADATERAHHPLYSDETWVRMRNCEDFVGCDGASSDSLFCGEEPAGSTAGLVSRKSGDRQSTLGKWGT